MGSEHVAVDTVGGWSDGADDEGVVADAPPPPSRAMEITVAVAGALVMGTALVLAQQIELRREAGPGQIDARFWPTLLAGAGLAAALGRLVVVLLRPADPRDDLEVVRPGGPLRLALTLVLTVAFVAVWELRDVVLLGYELRVFPYACALLLAALAWLYGARSWRSLVLFPVLAAALTYALFGVLLRIPL
ncbi:tripartite tricarboxylate transporter TctB family protein [Serinicoccus marinus]|uniref:tripartite tricarboxylate transporter TctB family protein n=1 Tax=Serinicoccus marinus TaxID=247333 RepID=UPI0003FFC991|nr:tripartite tricarboxylate transporter TctB family protein [Serinicoccus marinus]